MYFVDSIKINIDEFHRSKLELIDRFDYSKVAKKVDLDLGGVTKSYLDKGIENLKRYYAVALLDPRNRHAVSKYVDHFWHSHVLFTRDYVHFNKEIFGHYIHHEPLDFDDTQMVEHVRSLYSYTLKVYDTIFHEMDEEWWPQDSPATKPVVCLHMAINNQDVLAHALFPEKPELKPNI